MPWTTALTRPSLRLSYLQTCSPPLRRYLNCGCVDVYDLVTGAPADEPAMKQLKAGVCGSTCGNAAVTVHYPCDSPPHTVADRICLRPAGAPAPPAPPPDPALNCSNQVTVNVAVGRARTTAR
eukprot:TRINITY_DN992_c0_g1_i2.p2 TRINITY_DN992_c0_g1~~TRINITY_DN992_c0_g1_i2.p2  ORF type:complete len:123 (+),score=27.53 TRINITY_DN992_c0_g1_i2:443-811(+)